MLKRLNLKQQLKAESPVIDIALVFLQDFSVFFKSQIDKLNGDVIRTFTPVISVTYLGCSITFLVYYLGKEQVVSVIYHHSLLSMGKEVTVGITTGANMCIASIHSGSVGTTTREFIDSLGPL